MQLDLTRYRQPLSHFDRTFEPADVGQPGDAFRIVAPVHVAFDIHKDKQKFRLTGTVTTTLELGCSRCLEPLSMPIAAPFDLSFLPASEMSEEHEREVGGADLETSYYRDDRIDLNELLREQFYLALPMKPLCREECRGLCSQCGTNLNAGACECTNQWEDPRLVALKTLTRES